MSTPHPEASVLITTSRDAAFLQRCLRALDAQAHDPATFEVVVARPASTLGTTDPGVGLETRYALRVVPVHGVDAAGALVAAVEASRGRICIFVGEDVAATPKLVGAHLAAHAENERLVGIGRVTEELPDGRDWYARAAAVAWNRRSDAANERRGRLELRPGNFSVAREALEEVGGLPEASRHEAAAVAELASRLDSAGYAVRYLAEAHGVRRREEPGRRLLADRANEAAARAELSRRHGNTLPGVLGSFTDGSPREIVLRRSLLALRARPAMLAALGRLVPGTDRKQLWFGFVSNYAYWDAVRRRLGHGEWKTRSRGVPVLLYHAFGESDESSRFVVTRRVFSLQMRLLRLLRFKVLPYDELARSLRDGRQPPPRTAVLTIDDGYVDNSGIAATVLRRHGFGATIFLVSGLLGSTNDWSDAAPLRGRPLLSVKEVEMLRERGIDFGAHTRTHCSLPDVDDETMAKEIGASRRELEQALGVEIRTFAYPYGRFDRRTIAAVESAGFVSACTTEPRLASLDDHLLRVPRIEIKREDSLPRFLRKVWFGGA